MAIFIEVNRALCDITGYSEAELLQSNFQQITHPEDHNSDLEKTDQLLSKQSHSIQMDKRYIHKQGHVIWAILNAFFDLRSRRRSPLFCLPKIQEHQR